jgi:hypothetical protein
MSTGTLEPRLTKADLRVLSVIPACGPDEWRRGISETATLWQITEALDTTDLADVGLTLNGLERLDYVWSGRCKSRKRTVSWRTPKGDEAVSA